jgi:thiamine-monophosphate kinase
MGISKSDWRPALADYGERRLVTELLGQRYRDALSFGDDCAVIPKIPSEPFEVVATTDPCPEPLVASLGWDDLYYRGWLLGTINFSDLAAAGAQPLGLLVSYLLPECLAVEDFSRLLDGIDDCCRAHSSQVVGGNLGDASEIQLSATAIGACAAGKRLSRKGACAGDALLLVGSPGYLWSAALLRQGHAQLAPDDEATVFERALKPIAQLMAGQLLARAGIAHAAIDISDGLRPSVEALCRTNGLGAVIDANAPILEALPQEVCRQAHVDPFAMAQLWGDWTLLVAVGAPAATRAVEMLREIGVSCHKIGSLNDDQHSYVLRDGARMPWNGVDAERFTESSWARSKLSDYLSDLIQA